MKMSFWTIDAKHASSHVNCNGHISKSGYNIGSNVLNGGLEVGLKGIEKLRYRQTKYGVHISSCSWAQWGQDISSLNIGHIIRINVKKGVIVQMLVV
jgi:hypothetical protein